MKIKGRSKSTNIIDKRLKKKVKNPWTSSVDLVYVSPLSGKSTKVKYNRSAR